MTEALDEPGLFGKDPFLPLLTFPFFTSVVFFSQNTKVDSNTDSVVLYLIHDSETCVSPVHMHMLVGSLYELNWFSLISSLQQSKENPALLNIVSS